MKRRDFLYKGGLSASLALAGFSLTGRTAISDSISGTMDEFPSGRPGLFMRKFTSKAVEETLTRVKAGIADPELARMFENCFPNTLDTTVNLREIQGEPYTYIITGDIDAMWLRDSTAQVWPYLPLVREDAKLKRLVRGLIHQQTAFVLLDPYANAFYMDPKQISEWQHDHTLMKPGVHERKWEVDSLCYVIRLAHGYWKASGDASPFGSEWQKAMKLILSTFREQQRINDKGPYRFQRSTPVATDTQFGGGYGNPTRKIEYTRIFAEYLQSLVSSG